MISYDLQHGDCIAHMTKMRAGSVDLIIADLPYGTTQNRWDSVIPMDQLWTAFRRVCKTGAPIVLFTQQPFTTTVAASNLKQLRTEWIWKKPQGTGFLNCNRYPLKSHENILVFCDRTPLYQPQKSFGHATYDTTHSPTTNIGLLVRSAASTLTAHGSRLQCWSSILTVDITQPRSLSRCLNT
jgi:site-specific DNA-methyltransferase (adenine-specific)